MAHGHAKAYQEAGIPLVAVADISEEALTRFRDQFGQWQMYTDYRQMLDEVRPDIISVVTHDQLHCPMVVDAAECGVQGIVREKPMAMTLEEADRMLMASIRYPADHQPSTLLYAAVCSSAGTSLIGCGWHCTFSRSLSFAGLHSH
jgi:hypothetical protein